MHRANDEEFSYSASSAIIYMTREKKKDRLEEQNEEKVHFGNENMATPW